MQKTTFAVFFGNRGFFPTSLIAGARDEMRRELNALGHDVLMLDETATRHGAVETRQEGEVYANFLRENRGKFGGVVLCLPNFGDENGAVAALKDAGVPIWVQAYPDEYDQMAPATRRDSFCGKLSIMDVFRQNGVAYTALKPHTVKPGSARFCANIDAFDRTCQVVNGIKDMTVGLIGARTTPFKTVRVDELTLQRHHINVETFDMSDIIQRMRSIQPTGAAFTEKAHQMRAMTTWDGVPERAFDQIVRLGVAIQQVIDEAGLNAVALRCWPELETQMGISPCVTLGSFNDLGLPAACETDLGNAVAMRALSLASYQASGLLDWNNNYNDEDDKCILFHCGPMPSSLMAGKGRVTDHAILVTTLGEGNCYGCNVGRIQPMDFTFSSLMTDAGQIRAYLGEGRFTTDPIPDNFFGVAGVAAIPHLQDVLLHVGLTGHRHHVAVTPGRLLEPLSEALGHYLGFDVAMPQR